MDLGTRRVLVTGTLGWLGMGQRNVLTAAIAAGVRRAVVMSSNSPCGTNPHPDHRFDEAAPRPLVFTPTLGRQATRSSS